MAAILLQAIPRFSAKFSEKNPFFSATTYENYIVCKDYCIAHDDDKTCFLPAGEYQIITLGEVEELLHKLDTFCFTYQHVDCLYTPFKYRFKRKKIARCGNLFDNVKRAISFKQRNRGMDKMASIAKKTLEIKFKQLFLSALQTKKSTQTSRSVFAERIEKARKTKFELKSLKIVHCFLDGHGNYDKLVPFKIKFL